MGGNEQAPADEDGEKRTSCIPMFSFVSVKPLASLTLFMDVLIIHYGGRLVQTIVMLTQYRLVQYMISTGLTGWALQLGRLRRIWRTKVHKSTGMLLDKTIMLNTLPNLLRVGLQKVASSSCCYPWCIKRMPALTCSYWAIRKKPTRQCKSPTVTRLHWT